MTSLIGALVFGAAAVAVAVVVGLRARDGDAAATGAAQQALLGGAALVVLYGVAVVVDRSGGVRALVGDDAFAIALLSLVPLAVVSRIKPRRGAPAAPSPRRLANGSREVVLVDGWSEPPPETEADARRE